ncbi:hypothetical protein EV12_1591 [Prochlorococcus sp. MIT 0701]|nr:hypothetical protein EV12_1591 [Prochlorococcus sp. MIT 0701]
MALNELRIGSRSQIECEIFCCSIFLFLLWLILAFSCQYW